jgi:hypothetical protein
VALSHITREFGVNDAAIFKLTADPSGTAPTYASKVDVPGVQEMSATLAIVTKKLKGDNTVLAADSVLDGVDGSLKWARHGFDMYSALMSSTVSDSGTTPNQKSVLTVAQFDLPAQVKIEGQTRQVDYVGGDAHVIIYKCTPGSIPFGLAGEDYQQQSLDFTSVPLIGTIVGGPANAWFTILANETAVAIV